MPAQVPASFASAAASSSSNENAAHGRSVGGNGDWYVVLPFSKASKSSPPPPAPLMFIVSGRLETSGARILEWLLNVGF